MTASAHSIARARVAVVLVLGELGPGERPGRRELDRRADVAAEERGVARLDRAEALDLADPRAADPARRLVRLGAFGAGLIWGSVFLRYQILARAESRERQRPSLR